jgi:hypothetical protein
MTDFDNPWKDSLELFLTWFLQFFFPTIYDDIDWSRGYESLDKELQKILPTSEQGKRLADKLFKVWLKNGGELWILIHIEVQNQPERKFRERMYVYNYRAFDRFHRPVVSLAVLTDESENWRPREFSYERWGFSLRMSFPIVKLLDYATDIERLETDPNPFSAVVLAHLQTMKTRGRPSERYRWKIRLIKGLFQRGLTAEQIRQFFRLIDWLMDLPRGLEQKFAKEIHQYEKDQHMPYMSSIERLAYEEGEKEGKKEGELKALRRGIALALELKFGTTSRSVMSLVRATDDLTVLRSVLAAIRTSKNLDRIRQLLGDK